MEESQQVKYHPGNDMQMTRCMNREVQVKNQ